MKCLNAVHNLDTITKYLRFTKSEDVYQNFLKHYLPIIKGTKEFNEFIGDLADKALAKELTTVKKPEPTPEAIEAIAKIEAAKTGTAPVGKGKNSGSKIK